MKRWRIPTNVCALGVVMMIGECDCDPNVTSQPATIEHQLVVVSGGSQYGTINRPLARTLVVRYEERTVRGSVAQGAWTPASGVVVTWSTNDGGAFSPSSVSTDANGQAITSWTLGALRSSQGAQATITDHGGHNVGFTADAVNPVLEIVSGNNQTGRARAELPAPLVLRVRTDPLTGSSTPLPGQSVLFSTVGSGAFTPSPAVSDAQGIVTTRWTLGSGVSSQSASARASGSAFLGSNSVDVFAHALFTNFSLDALSGGGQSGQAGQPLRDSVVVKYTATDEATSISVPVVGATVQWVASVTPNGGAPGVANPMTSVTDQQGRAWTRWTLGANPGPQSMTASTALVDSAGPFSHYIAVLNANGGLTRRLRIVSGNTQTAIVGSLLPAALVAEYVEVNPSSGATNPITGTTVSWSVQSGGGSLNPTSGVTDAQGRVSTRWTLGSLVGTQSVRASATDAQAPAGSTLDTAFTATGTSSTPTPARMAYTVVDASGAVDATRTFNSRGGSVTAARQNFGTYHVLLGGLATPAGGKEVIQVTGFGSGQAYCKLVNSANAGADLDVTVRCYTPGGSQLTDAGFSIVMLDNAALPGRYAFAYANDPLAASYTPPNSFSTRQPIVIARRGTGEYDVQFSGAARGPGDLAEAVVLTASGSDGNLCTLHDKMVSATVRVHCWFGFDEDLTQHSDEPFSIALIERGRPGSRAATAWVQKSSFPQTRTLPADSASSTGGAVLVERTGNTALSILTFRGLGRSSAAARENVQLIGVEDADASYCKIVDWTSVPAGATADLRVTVQCYHEDGGMDDLSFYIIVIE